MALSDKQISKMWSDAHNDTSDRMAHQVLAKAVEAEVRKQDDALIRQMLEGLTDAQIAAMMRDTGGCASIAPRHALQFARAVERAHGIAQKGGS